MTPFPPRNLKIETRLVVNRKL